MLSLAHGRHRFKPIKFNIYRLIKQVDWFFFSFTFVSINPTIMKHFLVFVALISSFATAAQDMYTEYPYNPDVDSDEQIGVEDLMGVLSGFGFEFVPESITINGEDLSSFLLDMQSTITALQTQVLNLQSELAEVQSHVVVGLNDYVIVDDTAHTVNISGANLQVTNGLDANPDNWLGQESTNGLGNLIIGYNELTGINNTHIRTGSHNLVIGPDHSYSGYGNIIGGLSNTVNGKYSACIGSYESHLDWGLTNVILGGRDSHMSGTDGSVLIGGEANSLGTDSTESRYSVVMGGRFNHIEAGYANVISGGISNKTQLDQDNRTILGGVGNTQLGGYGSTIVGGRFSVAEIRTNDVDSDYKVDCLVGSAGRAFVGSTSSGGGFLIDTTFGEGSE